MSGSKNSKGRGGSTGRPPTKGAKNVVSAARRPTSSGRGTVFAAVGVIVVLVVVIGGVIYQRSQTTALNAGYGSAKTAPVSVSNGAITVGKASAPVTLDSYEDFLCPNCAQFEKTYGQQIAKALDDGKIKMRYHSLDFLNRSSASGDYSSRAAGAVLCVASEDPTNFPKFHSALFDPKTQPQENSSSDLSNSDLAKIAGDAGASEAAQSCVSGGKKAAAATAAAKAGATKLGDILGGADKVGTPTILNGTTKINISDRNWLSSLA